MNRLKLEPTAALVMKWAARLYNNGLCLEFINQLDLSSGEDLFAKCYSICTWYDEVILNRKRFIEKLIGQQLATTEDECQLLSLAAGKSPLALEILIKNYSKVHSIFEIDISRMDEKKQLYDKVCPNFSSKLRCITADITSINIANFLNTLDIGYRHDLMTIILLEGISYYISRQGLKNIIASFQSEKKKNFIIIEYLLPCEYVNENRRYIPKKIFKMVKEYAELNEINCYTEAQLKSYLNEETGYFTKNSMTDMEFARTGTNIYFKKPNDGWIECIFGKI